MAFKNQKVFISKLDGTTVYDLNKKIDYDKTSLEDRKKNINEILNNTNFYQEYFDNYYDPSIHGSDYLSSDNNVCRSLEQMANYLLNSDEVKEQEQKEKTKYVFYTRESSFRRAVDREQPIESVVGSESVERSQNIIYFLKRKEKNKVLLKRQSITTEDLERNDELGRILRDYKSLYDFVTEELKKEYSKNSRYILTRTKGAVLNDMIYTKESFTGVFGYHLKYFKQSTKYDIDVFDFTNTTHLKGGTITTESGKTVTAKGLLFFKPDLDPNDEFSFVLNDLQNVIDKADLTDFEKEVLELSRKGLTQQDIAESLDTYKMKVSRTIDIIAKKVAKVGERYDGKDKDEYEEKDIAGTI